MTPVSEGRTCSQSVCLAAVSASHSVAHSGFPPTSADEAGSAALVSVRPVPLSQFRARVAASPGLISPVLSAEILSISLNVHLTIHQSRITRQGLIANTKGGAFDKILQDSKTD